MAHCKACHKEIKFIRTEQGRMMPVDLPSITVITALGKSWLRGSPQARHSRPTGSPVPTPNSGVKARPRASERKARNEHEIQTRQVGCYTGRIGSCTVKGS